MTRHKSYASGPSLGVSRLLIAAMCLAAFAATAAPNPAYLSDLPTPARILAEVKGKTPEDTIERQMGAFQALMKVVDDMAWGLEHRYLPNRATPDENRIKAAYQAAYADLWHQATHNEAHTYDHDRQLMDELVHRVFSDNLRQTYTQSYAKAGENSKAQFQKNYGGGTGSGSTPGSTAGSTAGSASADGDFDKLCAAKHLDGFTCMVQSMMGGVIKVTEAIQGPPTPGLRMSGGWLSGNFKMILDQGPTAWINCDGAVLLTNYEVLRGGDRTLVKVANGADPFTVTVADDGTTLVGPAAVVIHGEAPGRSTTVTTPGSSREVVTTQERTLTPLEAQQYPDAVQNGQSYTLSEQSTTAEYTPQKNFSVPEYHPKTASCKFGTIAVGPAKFYPNGIRMLGTYEGAGGAHIEFLPEKAIIGCRATLEEHPYAVASRPGQWLIHLAGSPAVDFALLPDGTIRGEGASRLVNGHRKTGEDTLGDPTYAPSSDTCAYGALAPRGAGKARS